MICSNCGSTYKKNAIIFLEENKIVQCNVCKKKFIALSSNKVNAIDLYIVFCPILIFILSLINKEGIGIIGVGIISAISWSVVEVGYRLNSKVFFFKEVEKNISTPFKGRRFLIRFFFLFFSLGVMIFKGKGYLISDFITLTLFLLVLISSLSYLENRMFKRA